MNEFFNRVVLDNPVRDYFWVAGVILFVLILNKLISKYLAMLLCKIFKRQWKSFDQTSLVDLIIVPLGSFLVITVSIIALYRLNFPAAWEVNIYKYPLKRIFLTVAIIIQLTAFVWLLLRFIDFIASVLEKKANLTPEQGDNQLIIFFRDFLKVILCIIGFIMVLHFAFNYNISSLLTGLSIVGAAVALALRESLENLIASFVIFFDKPFTTGDFVKVQNVQGHIERIGLRSTRVRTADKSYVTVPNKQMVDSILDNVSLRSQIKGEVQLFVNLQTPPQKLQQLTSDIRGYLDSIERIANHNVLFNNITAQAFVVLVEYFTPPIDMNEFNSIKQNLHFFISNTLEKHEIKIAAEGRDLIVT